MIGEFHLEFNKNGEVIGVEILNASELLAEYDIPQKTLQNIEKTELKVVVRNNSLIVFLIIRSLNQEKSATITMNNIESPIMQAIASA
jgi:seryl-tRNA(Sec) selenium transferase